MTVKEFEKLQKNLNAVLRVHGNSYKLVRYTHNPSLSNNTLYLEARAYSGEMYSITVYADHAMFQLYNEERNAEFIGKEVIQAFLLTMTAYKRRKEL